MVMGLNSTEMPLFAAADVTVMDVRQGACQGEGQIATDLGFTRATNADIVKEEKVP